MDKSRRKFVRKIGTCAMVSGSGLFSGLSGCEVKNRDGVRATATEPDNQPFFKISLVEWSLSKSIFSGKLSNLEFPALAHKLGFSAVEYVNQFFMDKARNLQYLSELKMRANDVGIENVLILVDHQGDLGALNSQNRMAAVENHYRWVDAASFLGCSAIRVNVEGQGTFEEVRDAAVDGLTRLCEYGNAQGIHILVENQGGYSANGKWLADVLGAINLPHCGALTDFGNFCVKKSEDGQKCIDQYDRYQGVTDLLPYTQAVGAKAHDFDNQGNEINTDYARMLSILKQAGYTGYIGVEYEGTRLSEEDGINATRRLLQKLGGSVTVNN